ncbi:MAG TPA: hypothetical protein VK905_00735 [Bacillota bacterium]|nr:hypothetical protein [Bacillota bacterium]
MIIRRFALVLWLMFFPVAVTAIAALIRQLYPLQTVSSPWWAEVAVIAAVGLIFGRALGRNRQ